MKEAKSYRDRFKCPQGHERTVIRRTVTAGKAVSTYCDRCRRMFPGTAGAVNLPQLREESRQQREYRDGPE